MPHYFLLVITGIVVGIYGSTVGGASLLSLPLLILLGLPTPLALGTNRFSIVFLEGTGALRFFKSNTTPISWKVGLLLGVNAVIGSWIGSHLVLQVPQRYLDAVIGISLIVVLIIVFKKRPVQANAIASKPHPVIMGGIALVMGVYLGFIGAGAFGIILTMALMWQGYSFLQSAALSRLIGFCTSLVAAIVFISNGLVFYPYAIALGLGCIVGAWLGPGIALKKGEGFIRVIFIIVAVITAIKLVYGLF